MNFETSATSGYIDLRSDTVTRPTPAMRQAMAEAVVGDDQNGEDPTVNELERRSAEILGKEAAVFMASGIMGNLSSMLAHAQRGQEIIMGDESHLVWYEAAGASSVGGISPRTIHTAADGTLPPLFGAADTSAAQATSGRSNGANPIEGYTVRPHTANEQLIETRSLDWGLRVVRPGGEEHQPFSMVILRSPVNGALSTHMVAREMMDTDRADLDGIINGETVPEATLCIIEPAGMFGFAGVVTRMAVTIDASAVGPGGVRSVGEAESGC